MEVDEEVEREEEEEDADSIMDDDEAEPSEAEEGAHRRKSELDMAALTDEQAALAALESNQLLHLRLRKRYYSEALNFIRQVEDASTTTLQLLGSTHKPEVLESMEFFRVAHEYQLDSAQVSLEALFFLVIPGISC